MIVSTRQEGLILKGKLIVFEGLDGSGKNTQSEKFYEYMKNRGIRVKKKSFPDYKSQSAALINMYLSGQFGDSGILSTPMPRQAFMPLTATQATRPTGRSSTTAAESLSPTDTQRQTLFTSARSFLKANGKPFCIGFSSTSTSTWGYPLPTRFFICA